MNVVGLGGGIGASRLRAALARAVDPSRLTLIVNTADDLWVHGLRVCPDLDTTLYALSGRQDLERGWGLRGESWRCMNALRSLGRDVWFSLGDTDLATHLLRTGLLREGVGLVEVTAHLARALNVRGRVLPMTEDEVATWIEPVSGQRMHYEEFLVLHQAVPPIQRVTYEGIESATPAPGVLEALYDADLVIIAPSNPVASIIPILSLAGLRGAIRTDAAIVGVAPIVSRIPIKNAGERRRAASRAALLKAIGVSPTATGVAELYKGLIARYVIDSADACESEAITSLGIHPIPVPTLLHLGAKPDPLMDAVLGIR